jgi:hypothetical protein
MTDDTTTNNHMALLAGEVAELRRTQVSWPSVLLELGVCVLFFGMPILLVASFAL